ncbi:MAG: hypothetical protein AAGA44_04075 [Pseudomonadota bacterium]
MSEYQQHFGLQHSVFKNKNGADFFFASDQLKQVVGLFQQALQTQNPSLAVAGPAGCGKSVAVACALTLLPGEFVIAKVGRSELASDDAVDQVLRELGVANVAGGTLRKLGVLKQKVCQLRAEGKRLVVLVENGAETGESILAEIDVLCSSEAGIAMVVCGDDALPHLLEQDALAQARIRLTGTAEMGPLAVDELESFVKAAVQQAGGDFDALFSKDYAGLLHILSCGILRLAHNLTEASLTASAAAGEKKVSCATLADVAKDQFGITTEIPVHRASPTPTPAPAAVKSEDDFEIPELIQDTQPEIKALDPRSIDEPEEDRTPTLAEIAAELDDDHEQLPDLKELTAEFAAVSQMLEALEIDETPASDSPVDETPPEQAAAVAKPPVAETPAATAPAPTKPTVAETSEKPTAASTSEQATPKAAAAPVVEPVAQDPAVEIPIIQETVTETLTDIAEPMTPSSTETVSDVAESLSLSETATDVAETVEPPPSPSSEETPLEDVPAWDRDPTLAELRPDLDALELALHEDVDEEALSEEQQPEVEEPAEALEPAVVPEITLDDSIQEKVDREAAELVAARDSNGEAPETDEDDADGPSDTEVHRMMEDLSKANSLEDMDDKLAETLFGDEINMVASQVLKVAREKFEASEQEADTPEPVELSLEQTRETKALPESSGETEEDLRKQFEDTWGEVPGEAETIDLNGNQPAAAGLDSSASQRLATLRALNANLGKPIPASAGQPADKSAPTAKAEPKQRKPAPEPIEDQIDVSMTATFKALKINPDELAQQEEEESEKKGFFSRFRKKG